MPIISSKLDSFLCLSSHPDSTLSCRTSAGLRLQHHLVYQGISSHLLQQVHWGLQQWLQLAPSSGRELQAQDSPSSASMGRVELHGAFYGASVLGEATAKSDTHVTLGSEQLKLLT